ncbi:hypothetical protein JGG81_25345 [Salmonella enterica subsp. enterica serovar Typhimurium]|nr:hypothetical protein [Salmonella enterica subsp. enterica serovar Typhimurium]
MDAWVNLLEKQKLWTGRSPLEQKNAWVKMPEEQKALTGSGPLVWKDAGELVV